MKLIPFDPEGVWEKLKGQISNIFRLDIPDPVAQSSAGIMETETEVIVRWNLPGNQNVKVCVEGQILTLVSEGHYSRSDSETRVSYSSSLKQKLQLPVPVKGETVKTTYTDGVLEVRIEKK
ncbi:MAG TPA: Hsp20/alpha crystallin family protein [Verrucomicrobiae bacterium]|nr:Hsp20/alpha crystallin family protein [Verrucomicrobiae bacterium]